MTASGEPADPISQRTLLADIERAASTLRHGQTWTSETASVEIIDERPICDLYACFVRITDADGAVSRTALPPHYIVDNFALHPTT